MMKDPVGETKRYLESPACQESLIPFVQWITARHEARGGITEVRILGGPGNKKATWCGYFDKEHWEDLIHAILPLSGSPRSKIPYDGYPRIGEANIYFSLRPVHPDLLGRVANKIQRADQTTADADIIAYDMFAVDIDPERKSQISSSDEEKRSACLVAEGIKAWLLENGVKSIWADSGNGYHLLVPMIPYRGGDLPRATEDSKLLLHFLAEHFNSGQAKVDLSIFNPARILRLYGTLTVKGANLVGKRPHRWSGIDLKEIPEDIDLFGKLRDTIDEYKKEVQERQKPKPSPAQPAASISDDKRSWSREEGLAVLEGVLTLSGLSFRKEEKGGRTLFIFEKCPHHQDDDGHTFECCVMVEADGRYSASCKHDGNAHWKDFKDAIGWDRHKRGALKSLGLWRERDGAKKAPEQPPVDVDAELAVIKGKWPVAAGEKERNELLTESVGRLVRCPALERKRALEGIREITGLQPKLLEQVLSEQKRLEKEKAKESRRQSVPGGFQDDPEAGGSGDDLPWISAEDGELKRTAAKAWRALGKANRPARYFRCGGLLMRIERDDHGIEISRDLNLDRMRHTLARAAHFFIIKKKGEEEHIIPVPPPMDMVRDMLADPNPPFPVLNRIIEFPVFFEDGSFQSAPGYHELGRTYYAPIPGFAFPEISAQPGSSDIERAVGFISELLWDFPFVSESERAHAIALALLPFARELIDGPTPLHLIEAPSPGTGKGLLTEVVAYVALGRWPAMMTEGRDEDEMRKRLSSKLMGLPSIVVIDNLGKRLDSAAFSSALTCSIWEDRILGQSKLIRLPVRAVWIASGNNASLSNEVSRRTVRVRLDAKVDRPWLRQGFRHSDLRGWVKEHRADLVWSALTLIRAWFAAGRPLWKGQALGMFDSWSRVMGGILEVAGIKGFLGNLADLYSNSDFEGAIWRGFAKAWWDKFGDQEVGVSELFELANALDEPLDLGKGSEKAQRTRLGRELVRLRDRQFDNLRIVSAGERQRAKKWRLVSMPAPAEAAAGSEPQARFTLGSPIGSLENTVKNPAQSNGSEPGEPISNPYARGEQIFSHKNKKYIPEGSGQCQTGSPGSPTNGFRLENKAEFEGEPQGEPIPGGSPGSPAEGQAELDLMEGSL
ncbi:MAG: hypothetical protein HY611_03605 [Elusimicrobia bacterium]|nr:hypothetical protein [Elusimicrobiota bacterium]